jgi:hypothetical protein
MSAQACQTRKTSKSFLFLFFKKEILPSLLPLIAALAVARSGRS